MATVSRPLRTSDGPRPDIPALMDALAGEFTVVPGRPRVVRHCELDTFDRRLSNAGMSLRLRAAAGRDEELVLTGPNSTVQLRASDLAWPALAAALPDSPLRAAVAPVSGIRALIASPAEKRRVHPIELHDEHGKTVARLEVDEPTTDSSSARPADVRLHPLRGYDASARRTLRVLASLGWRPTEELSTSTESAASLQVDPAAPATRLLATSLREFLAAMRENLPGLMDDVDTEFLHDFRVAIRRTRSTLKLGRPVLAQDMRDRWEPAFKWLGDVTTPLRDLDVYELDLPRMREWLVGAQPADLESFAAHLGQRREVERRKLARSLRSARFTRLVAGWDQTLDGLAAAEPDPSVTTARELAATSISRTFRRVARDGTAVSPSSPAEDLHSLRKRCKELRYALEVFAPVVDPEQRRPVVRDLKVLQDVLGRFQDSEVQHHALQQFASEMVAAGTSARAVLAMGELVAHLEKEQVMAREDFGDAFARLVRPASRRRLQLLGTAG